MKPKMTPSKDHQKLHRYTYIHTERNVLIHLPNMTFHVALQSESCVNYCILGS